MADEEKKKRPLTAKNLINTIAGCSPAVLHTFATDDLLTLRDETVRILAADVQAECTVRAAKLAGK